MNIPDNLETIWASPLNDALESTKSIMAKLYHDKEQFTQFTTPSYLNVVEQMERTLKPNRRQHLETNHAFKTSGVMAKMQEIANSNQQWQKWMNQTCETNIFTENLVAQQSWLEFMKPIQNDFSHLFKLQTFAKSPIYDPSICLSVPERHMANVGLDVIVSRFQLEIPVVPGLGSYKAHEIANSNQQWQKWMNPTCETNIFTENLAAQQSCLEFMKLVPNDFSHLSKLQTFAKPPIYDPSMCLSVPERHMENVGLDVIVSRFQLEIPVVPGLGSYKAHEIASYWNLVEPLPMISDIIQPPTLVLPRTTRQTNTTSFTRENLIPRADQNENKVEIEFQLIAKTELVTSNCITLLRQVDPGLARPYIGARHALYDNNVDRARHILSSLRELWNHLLRRLAPDELVAAWILGVSNQKDLLHNGKPTRRARVLYVCRELNNDPLTEFLMPDTQALVKMIDLFNRVHELETALTDEQLRVILLRTDSWLMYILQISSGNFYM